MSMKKVLRKIAKFILNNSSDNKVYVNVLQANYGETLKDKIILITGGSSGIGLAIAKKSISEGAKVIITGRDEVKLKNTIKLLGKNASYIVNNNCDFELIEELFEKAESKYGKINVLINNAGISLHEGNILNVTEKDFDLTFDTNFKSAYFISQKFIKYIKENKIENANIIFISSETGSQCYDTPYGLTKSSINSLVGALSRRYYKEGLRVNAIAPGVTESNMTKEYANADDGNYYRNCASNRIFKPEEIAEVACFLTSDVSKCISGEIIHCNAGNHLNPFWED